MGDLRPVHSRLGHATPSLIAAPIPAGMRLATMDARQAASSQASLKILHVLRAPLGGLFRHVVDVTLGQIERGHRVGLIVDSATGGERANTALAELAPRLALGIARIPITRQLDPRDIHALRHISARIRASAPDVVHGHGAKGAALARLSFSAPNAIRVYTPHGGSLIYCPGTLSGRFYRTLERLLNWRTDLFLFESSYVGDLYRTEVDRPRAMVRIVRNGIGEAEFESVTAKPDATDLVVVGELRPVKAIDVLIDALAILKNSGRRVTTTIAGEGPEAASLKAQAARLGIADQVHFIGHCPARQAFAMGRTFVIPSRAESLPYVVLEAAAAGIPIIGTNVGGMSEIFGPHAADLIPPDDVAALIGAIRSAIDDPEQMRNAALAVKTRVRNEFALSTMVECNIAAYREALAMRQSAQVT
jgi:glycosyltransferase involved in cell wall biosynthesis